MPVDSLSGVLAALRGQGQHGRILPTAAGSTMPTICGPVRLVVDAPDLQALLTDWLALVDLAQRVPAPLGLEATLDRVTAAMADAFAAHRTAPPTAIAEARARLDDLTNDLL